MTRKRNKKYPNLKQQRSQIFCSFPFTKNQLLELKIEDITHDGRGVARINHTTLSGEKVKNWVIFVPFTLPGETVIAKIIHNGKTNSKAILEKILSPAPERTKPKCKHFFYCGGCHLQHINHQAQLSYKRKQVSNQISKVTGTHSVVNEPISSNQIWNYRSKITPRYQQNKNGKISAIGFSHHSNNEKIIDIQQCAIAMPQINQNLKKIRQEMKKRPFSNSDEHSILIRANKEKVENHPSNPISEKVGNLTFHFLAGDFFQNNPFILEKLTSYVREQALINKSKYLIDAYCGCGLFALSLADHFEKIVGIEVSQTSAEWARYNAEFNHLKNVTIVTASAEKVFLDICFDANLSCVIIDPPRAGCSKIFLQQLIKFNPRRIIYVSCDPSTQMRDLKSFIKADYRLTEVQPFDLFPHTKHLECVITLEQ